MPSTFFDLPCELRNGLNEFTLVRAAIDIATKHVLATHTDSSESRRSKQSEHPLSAHVSPIDDALNPLYLHVFRTLVRVDKTIMVTGKTSFNLFMPTLSASLITVLAFSGSTVSHTSAYPPWCYTTGCRKPTSPTMTMSTVDHCSETQGKGYVQILSLLSCVRGSRAPRSETDMKQTRSGNSRMSLIVLPSLHTRKFDSLSFSHILILTRHFLRISLISVLFKSHLMPVPFLFPRFSTTLQVHSKTVHKRRTQHRPSSIPPQT